MKFRSKFSYDGSDEHPGFYLTVTTSTNLDMASTIHDMITEEMEKLIYAERFVRCPALHEEDKHYEYSDWISTQGMRDVDTKYEYKLVYKEAVQKVRYKLAKRGV